MATNYEWTWEACDESGDITDCDSFDSYAECREASPIGAEIALVRRVGNDDEGELDKSYAYCHPSVTGTGLELPERFDDGCKVPKKYHAEIARAM